MALTILPALIVTEATNLTDQYFNQNQTAQFANDLLAMGDDTTEAVVRGLTTPQNVRKMLTDANSFVNELQTNLAGMT